MSHVMIDGLNIRINFKKPDLISQVIKNDNGDIVIHGHRPNKQGDFEEISICLEHLDVNYVVTKRGETELITKDTVFESLPSSYTGLAFKITQDHRCPYVKIKASPAKLYQGHNVFGTDNLRFCALTLYETLIDNYPILCDYLDFEHAEILHIDLTASVKLPNESYVKQFIQYLKRIDCGQTSASEKNSFDTTVYFGSKNSERKRLKVYFKHKEIFDYLASCKRKMTAEKFKRICQAHTQEIKDFAKNLLRQEAQLKRKLLKSDNYPITIKDMIKLQKRKPNLMTELWYRGFADVLKALKGQTMKFHNDEDILKALKAKYAKVTRTGKVTYSKAHRIYDFYLSIKANGYSEVKCRMPSSSFSDKKLALLEIGISQAFLQNLVPDGNSNVIPIINYFEVDNFVSPPQWWQDPSKQPQLKLVS